MVNQQTPEWHEMRSNRIGSSDAPKIMGVSPYGTAFQLWQEKLGLVPPRSTNYGMKKGLEMEDPARKQLEKLTGLFFLPDVRVHQEHEWMMSSIDAIDPEGKHGAEIKWSSLEDHNLALAGGIPDKYFPQVQHHMEVYELEMMFYFSYTEHSSALVKIFRDDKYIKDLLKKEKEFWDRMQEFDPPPLCEKDYEQKDDENWQMIASEWLDLKRQMKELEFLEEKEKKLRQQLISLAGHRNAIGAGVKLSKVISKGRVDYDSIPLLKEVNLDDYRKSPTESYRIMAVM